MGKKKMWNPGNKLKRFPLLCNKIGLLKFNQPFQNIANSLPHCCAATITAEKNWGENYQDIADTDVF